MIKVRWTGAAGIEFVTDQGVILIDPYLSRLGKFQTFFKHVATVNGVVDDYLNSLPDSITCIIAGHTHLDHALDIPYIAKHPVCKPDLKILGSSSLDTLFNIHGLKDRVTVCDSNNIKTVEPGRGISITMIPSVHGRVIAGRVPFPGEIDPGRHLPLKSRDFRHGTQFIPEIKINNTIFMHMGSADYIEKELDGHKCDILFMCVPGWKRRAGYTSCLIDIVRPEIIIPFHFDDFSRAIPATGKTPMLPFQHIPDFAGEIKRHNPGVKIIFPRINTGLESELF